MTNKGDYHSKYYPTPHNIKMRPSFVKDLPSDVNFCNQLQGCDKFPKLYPTTGDVSPKDCSQCAHYYAHLNHGLKELLRIYGQKEANYNSINK